MELFFLGTGAGAPNSKRNVSSVILNLIQMQRGVWLFDCGEATQHQLMRSPFSSRQIEKIFISHLHGDHVFGLPGIISSRSFQGAKTPLTIYGPEGIRQLIEINLEISHTHLEYDLNIVEVDEGELFEDEKFVVCCRRLNHVIPSFGYRIAEKQKQGALNTAALQADGVLPGPIYTQLKRGRTVTLPDGRRIDGLQYILPSKAGRIVALVGDTRYCLASVLLAENANLLLHESTFIEADRKAADRWGHSCSCDAATVAKKAKAKQLVLSHISARYDNAQLKRMLEEANIIFPASLIAYDFLRIAVEG